MKRMEIPPNREFPPATPSLSNNALAYDLVSQPQRKTRGDLQREEKLHQKTPA